MNIHEYQAKELLKRFGVPTPGGKAAFSVREAVEAAQEVAGPVWVIKAQIHAGGRGKGKFKEPEAGEKGGVRFAKSGRSARDRRADAGPYARHQADGARRPGRQSPARRGSCDIGRELYLSALVDRTTSRVAFIASQAGGMNIEEVAADDAGEDHHRLDRSGHRAHALPRPQDRLRARAYGQSRSRHARS